MLPSERYAAPDEISNSLMVFHDRTTGRRKWGVFNLSDRTERATADGGMRDGHWRMYWVYADESKPGQETGDVLELWRDPSFRMLNLGMRTYADDADPTKQYHQFQIVCGDETVLVAPDAAMFQRWWARLNEVRKVLQGNAEATSEVAAASSGGFAPPAAKSPSAPFDFPFDEDEDERGAVADPNFAPPRQAIAPHALHDTLRYQVGDGRWIIGSCALEPLHGEWRLVWHCSRPNQREVHTELELSRNPDFQFFDESVSDPASLVEQQPDRPPMRPTFAFRVVCGDDVAIFRAEDRYQQRRWLARLTELASYLAAAGQRDGRAERNALERRAEQQQQLAAKQRQRRRVVETAVARPPGGVNADVDAVVAAEVQATERGLNEVYAWLQAIGMASYTQVLVSEGFDTLARFATITQHDLVSLGVKRGHARAIIDAVRGRSATTWRSTVATLVSLVQTREKGECSFIYRYILRESCSQFDSLPLTSLTIPIFAKSPRRGPLLRARCVVAPAVERERGAQRDWAVLPRSVRNAPEAGACRRHALRRDQGAEERGARGASDGDPPLEAHDAHALSEGAGGARAVAERRGAVLERGGEPPRHHDGAADD
jgi:hypothetical protein